MRSKLEKNGTNILKLGSWNEGFIYKKYIKKY